MKKLTPYRIVAKNALMSWNGLSEDEATKIVTTATFEELEGQVWAKGSMAYAVEALAVINSLDEKQESKVLKAVLGGDDPFMTESDEKIFHEYSLADKKEDVNTSILGLLTRVHYGWVKDNAKKFNKEGRENKKYQHLPLAMIGWKEAKADLLFVAPILNALGSEVNESSLEDAYNDLVKNYFTSHLICDAEGEINKEVLARLILEGSDFYAALTPANTAKDKEEAMLMANQVEEKVSSILATLQDEMTDEE